MRAVQTSGIHGDQEVSWRIFAFGFHTLDELISTGIDDVHPNSRLFGEQGENFLVYCIMAMCIYVNGVAFAAGLTRKRYRGDNREKNKRQFFHGVKAF